MNRKSMPVRAVCLPIVLVVLSSFLPGSAFAREDYPPLVELRKISCESKTGKQIVHIVMNVHTDVPKGAKLVFELHYFGQPEASKVFRLKDENRRNVKFDWPLEKELTAGETYVLWTKMADLKDQTSSVRKKIATKRKTFPEGDEPWDSRHGEKKDELKFGTPAEIAAQAKKICAIYGTFLDGLVENFVEFEDKIKKVRAKELAVKDDGSLDVEAFEKILVAWCEKQGKLQEKIQGFPAANKGYFRKTEKAFRMLYDLGTMVSKAGWNAKREVVKEFGVEDIRPKELYPFFNRQYRYRAAKDQLQDKLDQIEGLVCKPVAPDPKKAGTKKTGTKKATDSKKTDPKKSGETKSSTGSKSGSSKTTKKASTTKELSGNS